MYKSSKKVLSAMLSWYGLCYMFDEFGLMKPNALGVLLLIVSGLIAYWISGVFEGE